MPRNGEGVLSGSVPGAGESGLEQPRVPHVGPSKGAIPVAPTWLLPIGKNRRFVSRGLPHDPPRYLGPRCLQPMASPDEPLLPGTPNCRLCGKPMEQGFIQGEANNWAATSILWVRPSGTPGDELAPLPFWHWSISPRFPAFRCEACGLVEVDYKQPVPGKK